MRDTRSHDVNVPITPGIFPEEPGANHLKLSVFHSKGGLNYFNYKNEAGGFYFSVRPVEVDTSGPFTSERYTMIVSNKTAFKVLLGGAPRFNRKTLDALWAKILPAAGALTELVTAGDRAAAIDKVTELVVGILPTARVEAA